MSRFFQRAPAALVSLLACAAHAQQAVKLPEIAVTAPAGDGTQDTTAGPVKGYQALTATSSTKTATPLETLPQSVQVVPRSLIDDQNDRSITEAVRNVSGTQGTNPIQTPAFESAMIRGFPAERWTDGLTDYYNAGDRDSLVNVERIEVLKGPNATLYGGGAGTPLGGVINVISKLPTDKPFSEIGITLGSHLYFQPYFDINTPLTKDGSVLFRMTGEYTSADSFIDNINSKIYNLNPTLLFTNKSDTTLTIQGRFADWNQLDYQGLPVTGTILGGFRLKPDMFIGSPDAPLSYSRVSSVTAKLTHTFDDVWSANVQARYGTTQFRQASQNFVNVLTGDFAANVPAVTPSTWNLLDVAINQRQVETSINANVQAKFSSGPTENKVLLGADFSRLSDKGTMLADANALYYSPIFVDLTNPVYPPFVTPANTPANVVSDGRNVYTTAGASAQIQTDIWEKLHLLAGVRLARLEIDSVSPTFSMSDTTNTTRALPRAGAVIDVVKGVALFADYTEGMKGNPFVFYQGTPAPELSRQVEAGVKLNLPYGLSGSAAAFQIDRSGVPVSVGLLSEAIGRERSRGFETDLIWQPDSHWQVLLNYAHVDATLLNDVGGAGTAGNVMNLTPPNSGRLWANYRFDGNLRGWSVGTGLYAASSTFVDLNNLYKTGGYVTLDAKVAYENERFRASLDLKNMTDAHYYVPYNYWNGRVMPGEPFAIYARLAMKL